MKRILLLTFLIPTVASLQAQKITAYAITSAEKGNSNWAEVKLIDVATGQEVKSIYSSKDQAEILNARTGKPVIKKDFKPENLTRVFKTQDRSIEIKDLTSTNDPNDQLKQSIERRLFYKTPEGKDIKPVDGNHQNLKGLIERKVIYTASRGQMDKPFSTWSAACAYDKKHDRLYYTPLGISQLRYIDLNASTPTVFYFEDETFGVLSNPHDVPNQITRMVIGSDGNGYALTNNANHLIKFTTNKKSTITDLGALTDDVANGNTSIHNNNSYGGDIVAGSRGSLYLIAANKNVFIIDVDSKVAKYLGAIKGLPRGYSTNGAMVEKGTNVIVSSANSTEAYYRFDINTLDAEKVSGENQVFNASDLASSALVSEKRKRNEKTPEAKPEESTSAQADRNRLSEVLQKNNFVVYPNPVELGGTVKLSFGDQPKGKYTIQFLDISGKMISAREVNLSGKSQVENYKIPSLLSKGNYLIKVVTDQSKVVGISTIVVQ